MLTGVYQRVSDRRLWSVCIVILVPNMDSIIVLTPNIDSVTAERMSNIVIFTVFALQILSLSPYVFVLNTY